MISADQAEDLLTASVEYLFRLSDREHGWLAGGRGERLSGWPEVLRDVRAGDYGDGQHLGAEAAPSAALTRRQVALSEAMLVREGCWAEVVPCASWRLVGKVIVMRRWRALDFSWEAIWEWNGGRSAGVTSDALRMRFDRAMTRLARRLTAALDAGDPVLERFAGRREAGGGGGFGG